MNKPDYINGSHTYSLLKCILEKISNKEFILDNNYVEIYKKINPIKSKLDRNAMYKLFYANQMLFNSIINTEKYDQVYNMLADKESKKVFDWLLEYKITFAFNEELSCAYYTRAIVKSDQNIIQSIDDSYFKIKKYCIRSPYNSVYETWVLQEYFHEKCKVLPTDIVISGGAFNGESSIWFADKAYLGHL